MSQLISIFFLCAGLLLAQTQTGTVYTVPYPNDPTTGTEQWTLTKLTSAQNAVKMSTSDTAGYIGVCYDACGKTGMARVAVLGQVPVRMDGTAAALDYVIVSTSIAGNGSDGGSTYPTSTTDVIGQLIQASGGAGYLPMVNLGAGKRGGSGSGASGATGVCQVTYSAGSPTVLTFAATATSTNVCALGTAAPITSPITITEANAHIGSVYIYSPTPGNIVALYGGGTFASGDVTASCSSCGATVTAVFSATSPTWSVVAGLYSAPVLQVWSWTSSITAGRWDPTGGVRALPEGSVPPVLNCTGCSAQSQTANAINFTVPTGGMTQWTQTFGYATPSSPSYIWFGAGSFFTGNMQGVVAQPCATGMGNLTMLVPTLTGTTLTATVFDVTTGSEVALSPSVVLSLASGTTAGVYHVTTIAPTSAYHTFYVKLAFSGTPPGGLWSLAMTCQ